MIVLTIAPETAPETVAGIGVRKGIVQMTDGRAVTAEQTMAEQTMAAAIPGIETDLATPTLATTETASGMVVEAAENAIEMAAAVAIIGI